MKKTLIFFLSVLFLVSCDKVADKNTALTQYIPRKAAVIIKTNDILSLKSELTNNDFIQAFKETPGFSFIANQYKLLHYIKPKGETLICFTKLGATDYEITLITKVHPKLVKTDSTGTFSQEIIKIDNKTSYTYLVKDDVLIASTSTLLLENIEREHTNTVETDTLFKNAYQSASSNASATIFIKGEEGATLYNDIFPNALSNSLKDSFTWTAVDVNLGNNDVRSSGVMLSSVGADVRFNLLRNTEPTTNRITTIAPISLTTLTAITYKDWSIFKNNKANYLKVDPSVFKISEEALFSTFDEVGSINLGEEQVIIAVSKDVLATEEAITGNDFKTNFRKVEIFNFKSEDAFAKAYQPLLNLPAVTMYAVMDDFYIFAKSQSALETIIANYQNKATLTESTIFKNTSNQLSDASSYLYIENLETSYFKSRATQNLQKTLSKVNLENYHYVASQLVQESDYMLLNGLITKNENLVEAGGIAQIANVKFNADLVMSPQLVRNHRTNGMDIVTQDVNNVLYLVSNAGKVLWQKELDGPVLGKMQQVDLYRNGRLQLAFTTPKTFYIFDRNGKEVAPYPLSFKDAITQPLAIFDYEGNRKYRFVITQDDQLMMYDGNGKSVTGFKFNKASGTVLFPPSHIRIANKDYITVAENTGKLNILSRTGASRIEIKEKINFGNTPIYKSGNNFETYDVNGEKITINSSGRLTQRISEHSSDSKITVTPQIKVGLRENELFVNGKKKEIPYGAYTKPTIATVNKKSYTSFTNTESSEVYIYDSKANILPNFPVYGISPAAIGYLENNKTLGFATQGSVNSILIYKIN